MTKRMTGGAVATAVALMFGSAAAETTAPTAAVASGDETVQVSGSCGALEVAGLCGGDVLVSGECAGRESHGDVLVSANCAGRE